jgi:pantoate--beta-alanine ligase
MKIFSTKKEVRDCWGQLKREGKKIGFVPTMGALHQGHLELVKRAKSESEIVICSIFVNPTQFDSDEDLKKYPRTLEADGNLLRSVGCDVVFAPSAEEMYDEMPRLSFDFGNLETVMEGKYRKGHFNGVGTVVAKLFNIVLPDRAYFGKKDLQQVAVVKRLAKDLSFGLEIIPCETIREEDGLAMSSRNRRLSTHGRQMASNVHLSLKIAQGMLLMGNTVAEVQDAVQNHFKDLPQFSVEYFEIVDFETFEPIKVLDSSKQTAICTANYLEDVRLIDNVVF